MNLNPDKVCNFDCVYCQVDRRTRAETKFVETKQLLEELQSVLMLVSSGDIYETEKFIETPSELRRLTISLLVAMVSQRLTRILMNNRVGCRVKRDLQLDDVKMVLITNASMFHRPHVQRGLELLDQNQGEVWAKLDAGTEDYYHLIERTKIPFQQVLDNVKSAALIRPIVIQSLFLRYEGVGPSSEEIDAFCDRLNEVSSAGGRIKLVQIYTVARRPAESIVSPLSDEEVDAIVKKVRERTELNATPFYGTTAY